MQKYSMLIGIKTQVRLSGISGRVFDRHILAVQNTFPYPILTKRIRIYPTKWERDRAALRVEFIGCKTGCLKSLGVSQDAPTNGQGIINTVTDSQMTASSQLVGHEASKGRISYQGSYR